MPSTFLPEIFSIVRVRKLRPVEAPVVHPALWSEWNLGGINTLSLPAGYELVGVLLAPVAIGKLLSVMRLERNGIRTPGLFSSTPIRRIHQNLVATDNSVYCVKAEEISEDWRNIAGDLLNALQQANDDPDLGRGCRPS